MESPATGVLLKGTTTSGLGKATGFTEIEWVQREFQRKIGFKTWPGTFNLRVSDDESQARWSALARRTGGGIAIEPPDSSACVAHCFPVLVGGWLIGAIVLPHVQDYPEDQIEVLSAENVRARLRLADGDPVTLHVLSWTSR